MSSPSIGFNPTLRTWLDLDEPGAVRVRTGKAELGQGIATALAQVVADALGVDLARVRMVPPRTDASPDESFTAGSLSVQHSGTALRAAALRVRALLEHAAAASLGTPVAVDDGTCSGPGGSATYWELAPAIDLSLSFDDVEPAAEAAPASATDAPRADLPDKVLGRPRFMQDLRLPGMAYGRVLRTPYRGARLASFDRDRVLAEPGVLEVVVDGSFVGLVAATEIEARAALETARSCATWEGAPDTRGDDARALVRTAPTQATELAESDEPEPEGVVHAASYSRPFIAHASIGPAAAAALLADDRLRVWSQTQGVYPLRTDLARALDLAVEAVDVEHVEGAGCYGHNGADDAAYDAARLAMAVPGRAVHVTWSREDELGWSPFGPAMAVDIRSTCAPDGTILAWHWDGFGNGHSSRPSTLPSPSFTGYCDAVGEPMPPSGDPPLATGQGTGRNAVPGYRVGRLTATAHRLTQMPVRASAMRALGAHLNVFAIESHVDDLARQFDVDPIEYRLRHLDDPRGRAVLEEVARMCGTAPTGEDAGRGVGYARYKGSGAWCAVVANIVARERIEVERLWIAVDVGRVVTLDGVVNQIEGGAIQAASWTLLEQVRLDGGRVVSDTWEEYPILRFADVPQVVVQVLDRPTEPWVGAGEAAMGPTAAAIGNAVLDAVGVRVRDLPLTPEAIVAAMDD